VLAVYEATAEAAKRALANEGPTLIVGETDRFCGAYEGDPQYYRTKEDVEELRKCDPIHLLRNALVEQGVMKAEELDDLDQSVAAEVDEAIQFAKDSPFPLVEDVRKWVYVDTHDDSVFL
jgi:TPP-dependent pyruvate/acetoin dehydrogenase alpha subunit